ncbi:MAG: SDR family oxidoreductase [Pseudomonadota bacterium]
MAVKSKRLFCFGYGYVCDYLGHALQEQGGWTLSGTTRDSEKRNVLLNRRIRAHIFDEEHPLADPTSILRDVTHVLVAAPPDAQGAPAFRMHAEDVLRMPNLEWFGYISTTGVYGDRNGGSVDEMSEVNPTNVRGQKRLTAERQWLSLWETYNLPVHIFRLSGIYGPGRSALDTVRVGVPRRIDKPGHKFNRIHVEDIVQAIIQSFEQPNPGAAYNLADDQPAPSHEVISYACELLDMPVPPLIPFSEADVSPMVNSFYKDNKIVLNNRIKEELGVNLKYPDYKSGLDGCLAAEQYAESQQETA